MKKENWDEVIKIGAYIQELDWFAIDKNGFIGMFSAVMNAPIPEKIKKSYNDYMETKSLIDSLPIISSYNLITKEGGNHLDWTNIAKKGLFAFDFHDVHRTQPKNQYDLIASPVIPININEIKISNYLFETLVRLNCSYLDGDVKSELIV